VCVCVRVRVSGCTLRPSLLSPLAPALTVLASSPQVMIIKGMFYFLNVDSPPLLDLFAYSSYKYVGYVY